MKSLNYKVVILTVLILSTVSFAGTYSGGSGNESESYQIGNPDDWQELMVTSVDWGSSFILTADVNLAGIPLTPVGNVSTNFIGVFDGNNHIISNAVINQPSSDYVGLFGYVAGAQIRNLGVVYVNITGRNFVGGLAGGNLGALTSCYATGSVTGDWVVGGLVGDNQWGTLTSCNATSSITGNWAVGGLVGRNWNGVLTSCYATGSVTINSGQAGGLVGENSGSSATVSGCYATGTVNGTGNTVGGLVGENQLGTLTSCYATGTISGTDSIGGLVGNNTGMLTSCYHETGTVNGTGIYVGGLVGRNVGSSTTVSGCYATSSVTGIVYVGGLVGQNLDGSLIACHATGSVYGQYYVGGLVGDNQLGTLTSCYATGSVTGTNDYVGGLVGKNTGTLTSCYATGMAIGSETGIYYYVGGLVGQNDGSLTNCYATGSVVGTRNVGGLVGNNGSSGTLTSCYATGSVSGNYYIGGLVGGNSGTTTSCYATGWASGTGNYVGGLVGQNNQATLTDCYATGLVTGTVSWIGGLVGQNQGGGTVTNCFWDTDTSGQESSASGTGLSTWQMLEISTYTDAGWDFSATDGDPADWQMPPNSYPRLAWPIAGDIAGSYGVNLSDYAEIAAHWGQTGCPTGSGNADVNNDGTVDIFDLMSLAENWLQGT